MDDILQHCRSMPLVRRAPGETLLTEGDPPGPLFVLVSGQVKVSKSGVDIVRIEEPGALFGEMSVLLDMPATATVTALSEVEVHHCADPAGTFATDPMLAQFAARLLAARLHAATTYIVDLKSQFGSEQNHLGMVDLVLDALLEGQPGNRKRAPKAADDPRL